MIRLLQTCAVLPALAGLTALCAQTASFAPAPADPALTVTAAPTFVSQYLFRGLRYGGPSLQPWTEADYGRFAAGIWSSVPVSDRVPGQSDPEIDPYASFTQPLGASASLVAGFQAYLYPRAPLNQGAYRSTYEPSLAVNVPVGGVRLTPRVAYDLTRRALTLELEGAIAVPLKQFGTELDGNAVVGTARQSAAVNSAGPGLPAGQAGQDYALAGVTLPFQVAAATKVSVGYAYSRGFDAWVQSGRLPRAPNPLAAGRGIFTAAVLFTF
jgi:hypothetical protein